METYNQLLGDKITSRTIDLFRFDAHLREKALNYLRTLEQELVAKVYGADIGGEELTAFRRARLEALLDQVKGTIANRYGEVADATHAELEDLAAAEGRYAVGLMSPLVEINTVAISPGALRAIVSDVLIEGAPTREWWQRQAGDILERFSDAMRVGMLAGETNDELVRRVRGKATGRRHRYELNGKEYTYVEFKGGVLDTSTRHAEALVRSSVQTVASQTRREVYYASRDVVSGIVQISTLDGRTSVICLAYGGKAWTFDQDGGLVPLGHDLPYKTGTPRHWNCRSTEAPLLDGVYNSVGTRISSEGQLPVNISMDEYLDRRTIAQQDEQLGVGRAEMWRSGKITLSEMLDQTGRPLTLAELVERYGAAARKNR